MKFKPQYYNYFFIVVIILGQSKISIVEANGNQLNCRYYSHTPRFTIHEEQLTASGSYSNPYTQVDTADVIITYPSTMYVDTLPMFWDGGSTWRFRFSPDTLGVYSWVINSTDAGLDGQSGSFECIVSSEKGSLVQNESYPYHFKRQNGDNIWFMGDTQWNLFRTIPYDSLNTETVKDYIDLRYSQGYNVVHFVTNTDEQWYDVDQDDPDSINLTFFQNGDERLAYLNSKGMIGGLLISWGRERGDGTWRDWDNFTTDENKIRYMRYVVARYSAYNIYWILSGEYDESLTADFDYLGEQLKRFDPHHRMIALHPGGAGSSEIYADTDWMTIADYRQTVTEDEDVHAALLSSREHNKPVVFSEYGYYMCDRDSNGQVDHVYEIMPWTRRMAWNIAMAGGYFITGYGATVLGGLRDDWAFTNMDDPKYDDWEQQVGYIKTFFENLDYWRLTPNDALITSGSGTHHLLYEDDSVYVVYAYLEGSSFQVNLSSAAGVYAGTRLDPITGSTVSIGNYNGGGTITVSVPDTNDYAYVFKRK